VKKKIPTFIVGFTLIEVMVAMALLALIVIALMAVFTTTQTAFRASITQTDVLEGGRAAMDLMAGDLKLMSASRGTNNGAVNFYANTNNLNYTPLQQQLVGSISGNERVNILEKFFILSRENQTWTGVGYAVDNSSSSAINPLYRFSMSTNVAASDPLVLYRIFTNGLFASSPWTNMSHLIDGVVDLRVHAFDNNGTLMTNGYTFGQPITVKNVLFLPTTFGENGFYMFSNALPASVEIEMATVEDQTLRRAEVLGFSSLTNEAGKVHVFRQRVSIPNVDPAAYQ
jgi:prepilin-type N-terminal cleavage/methylation domain-containing protein